MTFPATLPPRLRPARLWLPAAVLAALAVATTVAVRTPQASLADPANPQAESVQPALSMGRPHIAYRLEGSGRAEVTYIADSGDLAAETVTLPWSHEVMLSSPMRPASVTGSALGGGALSCTLRVDGRQRDAQASTPGAGVVLCSVVAA